ncbi:MAG: hypothetical protein M3352_11740 [Bacteroidota bacterium]|nr:hypothetical protein [Bacteroidota bacterium]
MFKKIIFLTAIHFLFFFYADAQKSKSSIDSTAYYNDLFNELDGFLDSLTSSKNMWLVSIGAGNSFLNYQYASNQLLQADKKIIYSPSIGFFHKNGLGINLSSAIVKDGSDFIPFQYVVTGSYDYLHSNVFSTGVSYSHFFTKDALTFYTSPLQNEALVYIGYKKSWVKPSLTATFGWGSFTSYEKRKEHLKKLRKPKDGNTNIETKETVNDFSLAASVRHDFYWFNVINKKGVLRLTPRIAFTSGTQKFGFYQTSSSYSATKAVGNKLKYNSENVVLDDKLYFQPLSLAAFIKPELTFGHFFVQSQIALDYYFPTDSKNFTTNFSLNLGFIF